MAERRIVNLVAGIDFADGFAHPFAYGFTYVFASGFGRSAAIPHRGGDCGPAVLPTSLRHIEVGS